MKPRVYLETSVISYLVGWLNQRSILVAHNQEFTREWWSLRRSQYELFSSAVALNEAKKGEPPLAKERLSFLAETTLLDITDAGTGCQTSAEAPYRDKTEDFLIAPGV